MSALGMVWANRAWRGWQEFWFEADSALPLRQFRRWFAVLLLIFYSLRTPDLELFFSEKGILPLAVMDSLMDMKWRYSLLHVLPGDAWVWGFHFAFLTALLCLALELAPRASAIVAFVLHVSFLHRNFVTAYGIDLISTFFLFNLCLASRAGGTVLDSLALRLCQLQVCIIYAYSGLEKFRGATWWDGTALWYALSNPQLARFDFSWVSEFPGAIAAATWSTLIWEVYFPALIWVPALRYPLLLAGVALHLGIALTIGIPFFGFLMIVSYLTFMRPQDLQRVSDALGRKFQKNLKSTLTIPIR